MVNKQTIVRIKKLKEPPYNQKLDYVLQSMTKRKIHIKSAFKSNVLTYCLKSHFSYIYYF